MTPRRARKGRPEPVRRRQLRSVQKNDVQRVIAGEGAPVSGLAPISVSLRLSLSIAVSCHNVAGPRAAAPIGAMGALLSQIARAFGAGPVCPATAALAYNRRGGALRGCRNATVFEPSTIASTWKSRTEARIHAPWPLAKVFRLDIVQPVWTGV